MEKFQSSTLVWFNDDVNTGEFLISQGRSLNEYNIHILAFDKVETCIDHIKENTKEKIIIIISDSFAGIIVDKLQVLQNLGDIYSLCKKEQDEVQFKELTVNHTLTKTDRDIIVDDRRHQSTVIKIFNRHEPTSTSDIKSENGNILWFYLFIETLIRMQYTTSDRHELINYLKQMEENQREEKALNQFIQNYSSKNALTFYTNNLPIYRSLNAALRGHNIDILVKFGFFIADLNTQLFERNTALINTGIVVAYRGQFMSKHEFDRIQKSIGDFVVFDSFLSTSTNITVADMFMPIENNDRVPILIKITINTNIKNTKPYANISALSQYPDEEEILFMLGTIFQIKDVQIDNTTNQRIILLDICSDDDQEFKAVFSYENEKFGEHARTMSHLCNLLYRIGDYDRCQEYYKKYVQEHPEDDFFYQLIRGIANMSEFKLDIAMACLQQAEKLFSKNDCHTNMIRGFFNEHFNKLQSERYILKAVSYGSKQKFYLALINYEKALKLQINCLPPDHPYIGRTYFNIGSCYCVLKQYQEALKYLEKSLDIRLKSLPSTHSAICESLNLIATTYEEIGNNKLALEYYTTAQGVAHESNLNLDPIVQSVLDTQINKCRAKVLENQQVD